MEIRRDITRLKREGNLGACPSVLAFQSIADATVSTPEQIEVLFAELPDSGHELALFDIDGKPGIEPVSAG